MDPLTHTLVGAALAETPLGRVTRRAPAALILGANAPDIDILSYLAGADSGLGFRRGWTHGVAAWVVLPLVLTALLLLWDRLRGGRSHAPGRAAPGWLVVVSTVAVLTHPLLDWLNTYGIRLAMPFSEHWYYGDAVFIVDPWLWLILGGTLLVARAADRRVTWWGAAAVVLTSLLVLRADVVPEAAKLVWLAGVATVVALRSAAKPAKTRSAATGVGLGLALLYAVLMVSVSNAASAWVRAELGRNGIGPLERLMVGPTPADPFRWDVVADLDDHYRYGTFRWFGAPRLELDPRVIHKPGAEPALRAAMAADSVRGFLRWARFPGAEIENHPDGITVYLLDARYTRERTRGFGGATVRLDRSLRVRRPRSDEAPGSAP